MIVDAFTFYNEFDILEIRLKELSRIVDRFVLVEADRTYRGAEKPMLFEENRGRFSEYLSKIEYVPVHDMPTTSSDPWQLESHQRRCISRGLDGIPDDALIMVSDVDEIPSRFALQEIVHSSNHEGRIYIFNQIMCYHYLNWRKPGKWYGTRAMTKKNLIDPQLTRRLYPPQGFSSFERNRRKIRWYYRTIRYWKKLLTPIEVTGGWHFSYIGDAHFIRNKIRSFSHSEYDNEYFLGDGTIEERIASGRDIFGNNVEIIPLEKLPDTVSSEFERYQHLIDSGLGRGIYT